MFLTPFSRRAFVAGVAATGLALAGCTEVNTAVAPGDDAEPDAPTLDNVEDVNAQVASVLTAVMPYDGATPNPVGASSALFVAAGWHVYEGLYELDLHTYRPTLGLAADIPMQVSELEYTVTLREDARFSDGSIVTAADVANAFHMNMLDDLYGPLLAFIQSVRADDDTTLVFSLRDPMGTLLRERLSLVRVFPARMTPEELAVRPIGSGPWSYDVIEATDGGRITFVPNKYYAGEYPATCERMTWYVELDDERRTNLLTSKQALCMEAAPLVLADQIEEAGAITEYVPGFNLPFLMFNCRKPPFNDARVRQALLYALDVDRMISQVLDGHARPCTCLLPDYYRGYHRVSTVYSYDKEKARQLLAEAGIVLDGTGKAAAAAGASAAGADAAEAGAPEPLAADGPADGDASAGEIADGEAPQEQPGLAIELRANNNWAGDLVKYIVEDWSDIGITCTVTSMDTPTLFADLSTPPASPEEVLPFDVVLSPGDPSCFGNDPDLLMMWWYGDNLWTRARTCWADTPAFAELSELLQQARRAEDENEQQDIWNHCFDLIAAEAPLYPLFHREMATAYYESQLEPYDPISTTGLLFLGTTPMKAEDDV